LRIPRTTMMELQHSLPCGHFWSVKQGPARELNSLVFTLSEKLSIFDLESSRTRAVNFIVAAFSTVTIGHKGGETVCVSDVREIHHGDSETRRKPT
jgi:hypothetical protein